MANSKEAAPIDSSASGPRIESTTISSSPSPLTASLPSANLSSQTPSASVGEAPNVSVNECGKKASESSSSLKRYSSVWEHFTPYDKTVKVKVATGKIVDVIQKRAHCKYCPRGKIGDFVVESRKGTSGMRRHMNENCSYFPKAVDKAQKILGRDKSNSKASKLTTVSYSQVDYLAACVGMIVIDEFPFSFVEKIGFNRFCAKVCPLFNVPSRRKLCRSFLATYETQKLELKKILKQYRLSLTTDTWTSVQQVNYMVITAHFVDEVDQYLDSPLDPTEEEDQFDILGWWRINGCKYPVLAAIARDILAIQTSTVASESCFSTGGRVISAFRSSLTSKSVEGVICLQNWMLGDDIADILTNVDEPSIENTEFYSEVEQELESSASSVSTKTKPSTVLRKGKSLPTEVINV